MIIFIDLPAGFSRIVGEKNGKMLYQNGTDAQTSRDRELNGQKERRTSRQTREKTMRDNDEDRLYFNLSTGRDYIVYVRKS